MRKVLLIMAACLTLVACGRKSGEFEYAWQYHYMDSRYDTGSDMTAVDIISKYEPQVAPLMEIIGYTDRVIESRRGPESELSNFAADVIRARAEKEIGEPVQLAMTNYGGIRTAMPKGDVRVYDIFSIFPFENDIVVCKVKGSKLRQFFDNYAKKGYVECLSGVELVIDNYRITKFNIAGKPLDPNKTYNFATINFLLDGGDGSRIGTYADKVIDTDVLIRDAVVDHIKSLTAQGKKIDPKMDGRVVIKNVERN
ncbi:MAG: 5'-nucleotidase C-terminal domain-containing protein [Bacteroidales bacterium]|nr:5'-nucleotidase C-terminal domain-containing protein [Bacteroidales bacterium]